LRVTLPDGLTVRILQVLTGRRILISEKTNAWEVDDQKPNENIYKDSYLFKDRPRNEKGNLVLVTVRG
jgi:hypothetical protein